MRVTPQSSINSSIHETSDVGSPVSEYLTTVVGISLKWFAKKGLVLYTVGVLLGVGFCYSGLGC